MAISPSLVRVRMGQVRVVAGRRRTRKEAAGGAGARRSVGRYNAMASSDALTTYPDELFHFGANEARTVFCRPFRVP